MLKNSIKIVGYGQAVWYQLEVRATVSPSPMFFALFLHCYNILGGFPLAFLLTSLQFPRNISSQTPVSLMVEAWNGLSDAIPEPTEYSIQYRDFSRYSSRDSPIDSFGIIFHGFLYKLLHDFF